MEYFEELTLDVIKRLDPGGEAHKIVIARDLLGDVIRNMAMDVKPCLDRERIRNGFIGLVHYDGHDAMLLTVPRLPEGTLHVCYEEG